MLRNNIKIIDWDHSKQLTGNKERLAQEILALLIKKLPDDIADIKSHFAKQNYLELKRCVHKLHGALCYCSAPRLKQAVVVLESALKSNIMSSLPSLLDKLISEADLLLEHYSLNMPE